VDLDRSACVASLVMGRLCTRLWFEYVESHSNWSDGISRLLSADPFSVRNILLPSGKHSCLLGPGLFPWVSLF